MEVVVTDKMQISVDKHVYKVKEKSTGKDFYSLPIQAQKAIGEHVQCRKNGRWGVDCSGFSSQTIEIEIEREPNTIIIGADGKQQTEDSRQ